MHQAAFASLAEIAAASQKEREDADMVRKCLPARIDALLPQELAFCFEHELWQMVQQVARGAAAAAAGPLAAARRALRLAVVCVLDASEGFDARLGARAAVASATGTAVLDDESRRELRGHFSAELGELLAAAMPRLASIATAPETVAAEAARHLRCVLEAWESVMMCKTQITDLYMDNDELSARRQEELLEAAAEILSQPGSVDVAEADLPSVCAFLHEASKCQSLEEDGPLKSILAHLDREATWVATRLGVAARGDAVQTQRAARRIQSAWKRYRARAETEPVSPLGLGRRNRLSPGRGFRESRSCDRTSWRWSRCERISCALPGVAPRAPEALSIHLLLQGWELLAMLPEMPAVDVLTQFQRNCMALDVSGAPLSSAAAVAFWLNVRNLVVVTALLQQVSRPEGHLPVCYEDWVACLGCTSLFVMGKPFSAQEIDHRVLGLGSHSPLPPPARQSLHSPWFEQSSIAGHVQGLLPWPIFGLWLPVRFGLPGLRAFESEILLAQLRSSAESLVDSCRGVAETSQEAGYQRGNTLRLPPMLRLSCAVWQPLLKCRGTQSLSTELCDVDWTFAPTSVQT